MVASAAAMVVTVVTVIAAAAIMAERADRTVEYVAAQSVAVAVVAPEAAGKLS
jgi:hypothetical protein